MKTTCPVCSDKKTFMFHAKVWHLRKGCVLKCSSCGIVFISPLMTPEKEKAFYAEYNKHVKARGVTISSKPEEFHKSCMPAAQERYKIIGNRLKKYGTILEIGASTGAFLQKFGRKKLSAIEPCDDNRAYSIKFAAHTYKNIEQLPKKSKFGAIVAFHVFEHIKTPVEFLRKCKEHLKKDGVVLIEVPFIEDPLISLYNCAAFKDFYFQPMHPYVYSLKALRYVFSKAGLKEKKVMYYQRYGLDNHLGWLSKGKGGGDSRLKTILGDDSGYKKSLQAAGTTDTIFYEAGL